METPIGRGRTAGETSRRRFVDLFTAHSDAVLGYALRRVDRPEDAADILADTFLVAWRRIDDVPDGEEGRLWLYGVARRVLANHRRGTGRQRRLGEKLATALDAQPQRGPSDHVETSMAVRQAMDRLGDDDRELFRLTCWEGLTPTELAAVLSVPPVTVRTRLYRARRRLRTLLVESGQFEPDPIGSGPAGSGVVEPGMVEERSRVSRHLSGDGHPPVVSGEGPL